MDESGAVPGEQHSIALALVNTYSTRRGIDFEAIATAEALQSWLAGRGAHVERRDLGSGDVEIAHHLRTHVRALFEALESSVLADSRTVQELNRFSMATPGAPTLDTRGATLAAGWASTGDGPAAAFSAIARDAIAVALSPVASRIRTCDAGSCIRMFVPERASRRWCSTVCGDRVRAARHYAQHRR